MKVTAFVGSARKKHTYRATEQFLANLKTMDDVETEIVMLSDYDLKPCQGCKLCLDRGEELCLLKDGRNELLRKLDASDGVIFATPNYSFQVSGLMKLFLDRLAWVFHRPRYFGKTFVSLVTQGIYGGKPIVKYLGFTGSALGFNTLGGICLNSLEPVTEKIERNNREIIRKKSAEFYKSLVKKALPVPSIFKLMMFRMSRTTIKAMLNDSYRDFTYFRDSGWFESDYHYPVKLPVFHRLAGVLFDSLALLMASKR